MLRSNKLILALVALVVVVAVIVGINSTNQPQAKKQPLDPAQRADVDEVDGDNVFHTVSEIQARYKSLEKRLGDEQEEKKALQARLDEMERRQAERMSQKNASESPLVMELKNQLEQTANDLSTVMDQMAKPKINSQTASASGSTSPYQFSEADLGIGQSPYASSDNESAFKTLPGYVRIIPMTRTEDSTETAEAPSQLVAMETLAEPDKTVRPVYTIPARATLLDNKAMTTLIGRVPVGGEVADPFPVKIIVNNDNLATNGLTIPGLKGIVFSGIAKGNWNLSCVTVDITGGTFTFNDGRIQHLEGNSGDRLDNVAPITGESERDAIGYISDPMGTPCIQGRRVTDAHNQLITMGILGAAKSYFEAKAGAETTRTSSIASGVSGSTVTGNTERFAENETIAGAIGSMQDFYNERTRDTFDAVVVPAGADIAVHINQDLLIDYNPSNRKLVYDQSGGFHASNLD